MLNPEIGWSNEVFVRFALQGDSSKDERDAATLYLVHFFLIEKQKHLSCHYPHLRVGRWGGKSDCVRDSLKPDGRPGLKGWRENVTKCIT